MSKNDKWGNATGKTLTVANSMGCFQVLVTNTALVTAPSRPCNVCFASIGYPLAKDLNDLMVCTWLGLCLASLIISLVSFRRRGLVGFCFGLLCMLGAGLCY